MVAQQEAIVGENSVVVVSHQENYHNQLLNKNMMMIKGKRTKRARPLSPLDLTMSSATTTDEGGSATSEEWAAPNSTVVSSEEEEQDMAHCLILLAQGANQHNNNNSNNNNSVTTLNNIKGSNVISCYECKTCNKTFSSFQALGGHRASHKKPKPSNIAALSELKKSSPVLFSLLNHHDHHHHDDGTTLSLQISNSTLPTTNINANNNNNNNNKTKVHECGICGAEFSSGQALGGHMRRHRPIGMATTTASENNVALINAIPKNNNSVKDEKATRNLLSLDLNLPAPEDEQQQQQQQRESSSKFVFSSNEKTLVFAAASSQLVDCHY